MPSRGDDSSEQLKSEENDRKYGEPDGEDNFLGAECD